MAGAEYIMLETITIFWHAMHITPSQGFFSQTVDCLNPAQLTNNCLFSGNKAMVCSWLIDLYRLLCGIMSEPKSIWPYNPRCSPIYTAKQEQSENKPSLGETSHGSAGWLLVCWNKPWLSVLREHSTLLYLFMGSNSTPEVAQKIMSIPQVSIGTSLGCSIAQLCH